MAAIEHLDRIDAEAPHQLRERPEQCDRDPARNLELMPKEPLAPKK